jgi:hypothetical protein
VRPQVIEEFVAPIAQTNLQLYNQLLEQRRPSEELALVRRAYQLASLLYSGHYQGDGKPFVCHSVGVASILARLNLPGEFIAVGLIHNIFVNGDFGDGRRNVVTSQRRELVKRAVGDRVAVLTERFQLFRISAATVDAITADLDRLDGTDRDLLTVDLADALEKYVDCGLEYFGDAEWIRQATAKYGDRLIDIAVRLGQPALAAMLRESFSPGAARPKVPDELRQMGQEHLELVVPRSCRKRWSPIVKERLRRRWRKVRPRSSSIKRIGRKIRKAVGAWSVSR